MNAAPVSRVDKARPERRLLHLVQDHELIEFFYKFIKEYLYYDKY
jgi:hypothetical protein